MQQAKILLRCVGMHPDRRSLQNDRGRKRHRNLKVIPAAQLDLMLHRDMKAKNSSARFSSEQNRTLLCLVARSAGTIHRERSVTAVTDFSRHFYHCPQPPGGARAACGAKSEALDALSDGFAIAAH